MHLSPTSKLGYLSFKCNPRYIIPIYMEQKLSDSQSGSQSRICTLLYTTFIVQYNKAHNIVDHCSVNITWQSTLYLDWNNPDCGPDGVFTQDKMSGYRSR